MNDSRAASLDLIFRSPDDTAEWAKAFAVLARAGLVICLWGDVGAGKTFFARNLIQHLQSAHGLPEDVPSPTFTLVQTYDAGDLEIWHADLYRLTGPSEVDELGLIAAFDTALCLIEWPDRLGQMIPDKALHMTFSHAQSLEERHCKITCTDADIIAQCRKLLQAADG